MQDIGIERPLPVETPGTAKKGRINRKLIFVGLVVVLSVAYLIFTATKGTAAYYVTVSELKGMGDEAYSHRLRLGGKVVPGSIIREGTSTKLQFNVYDDGGNLPVVYRGIIPDIFGEDVEVVVEGRYNQDGVFAASTLLAKCPSKFESALDAETGGATSGSGG